MLPLYVLGGIAGGLLFLIYTQTGGASGGLIGASGSITCLMVAAACVAPDYEIRLILIGNVKLKYIALFLIIMDIAMIGEQSNVGGRIAHLGGALLGGIFIYLLREGRDITDFSWVKSKPQAKMEVVHNKKRPQRPQPKSNSDQERIDEILDKINASGYDSLTAEEKEILYQASKK